MQITMNSEDLSKMEKRFRAHFVNSLSGPKSANLIGTVDKSGNSNLSIVSSCVHLGADPSLMAMVIRPRSVPRHTIDNLIEVGYWTVNHVNNEIIEKAHQTSARYPKEQSEFEAVNLREEKVADFPAPFVKEAKIRLGMKLVEIVPIKQNSTELVIGEIVMVNFPEDILAKDGFLDIASAGSVAVSGLDSYLDIHPIIRLSYAKPDKKPEEI